SECTLASLLLLLSVGANSEASDTLRDNGFDDGLDDGRDLRPCVGVAGASTSRMAPPPPCDVVVACSTDMDLSDPLRDDSAETVGIASGPFCSARGKKCDAGGGTS